MRVFGWATYIDCIYEFCLTVSRRLLGAYRKISGWRSSWYHLQLGVHNHHLHGMESNSHGHAYSTLLHARLDFFAATLVCLLSIFLHSLVASLFFLSGFQKRKVPAFFLFIQAKEKRSYRTYCFLMFLLDWNWIWPEHRHASQLSINGAGLSWVWGFSLTHKSKRHLHEFLHVSEHAHPTITFSVFEIASSSKGVLDRHDWLTESMEGRMETHKRKFAATCTIASKNGTSIHR